MNEMARASTAVLRAAAILDFIAEHPGQAFTMAELVRALKLSQSTCHSVLSALVQVGYLFRTTERTYVLGPRFTSIGKQAADRHSPLQIAKPEMRKLALKFDVLCSAVFREGRNSIVRERAASARNVGLAADLGAPLKLRSPLASIFLAWSPNETDGWLSAFAPPQVEAERKQMERGAAFVREHGFILCLKNPVGQPSDAAPEALFEGDLAQLPIKLATSLKPETIYDLSSISAPVFNAEAKVAFVISMRGFARPMAGAEIFAAAAELKDACARISAFSGASRGPVHHSHV